MDHIYYFDMETTGIEPRINQIITIQYAELNIEDLEPLTDLMILKIWETDNEKNLIKKFIDESNFFNEPFTFIPLGVNVLFDLTFLYKRAKYYGLIDIPYWKILRDKPFIDLKTPLVLMNNLKFKEYDSIVKKIAKSQYTNKDIPIFYEAKDYGKIEEYIKTEFNTIIKIAKSIYNTLIQTKSAILGST